jgi:hypothetical protein
MKVSPTLFRRSTDFINLAEQLKADVEQLRLEKQTGFETQSGEWRNSEQGDRLADEIALLEDLYDALENVLHQLHDLFTPGNLTHQAE